MPLSAIFQLYLGSPIYCWRKPECPKKTTDLLQVTDRLFFLDHVYTIHIQITLNKKDPETSKTACVNLSSQTILFLSAVLQRNRTWSPHGRAGGLQIETNFIHKLYMNHISVKFKNHNISSRTLRVMPLDDVIRILSNFPT